MVVTQTDAAPDLRTPLQFIKGVGPQRASQLERKGLRTVEDALFFVPLRHEDRTRLTPFRSLVPGQAATCSGVIVGVSPPPPGRSRVPFTVMLRDSSGYATASWFGWRYLSRVLKRGQQLVLHGRVGRYKGAIVIQQPDYEIVENGEDERLHTGRLVPVYSLTEGLPQRALRALMWRLVESYAAEVDEVLPEGVRTRRGLVGLAQTVKDAHFPQTDSALAAARRRLSFDEGLLLQLGLAVLRSRVARARGLALNPRGDLVARLRARLPWKLTGAQERVWEEIRRDMAEPHPMHRLLQGDVGSGKTVVAAMAAVIAAAGGFQTAVMAPTELLAEQHFRRIEEWLAPLGIEAAWLTGRLRAGQRRSALHDLQHGRARLAIGTHALVQREVRFANLGLAIVDEQHRFGVAQRLALRDAAFAPHLLMLSATPIPRTLAMTYLADLDVSVIDRLPPGRQPVATKLVARRRRDEVLQKIRAEVGAGRQAYWVCPSIEEGKNTEASAAIRVFEDTRASLPELRIGLLHGALAPRERSAVMQSFVQGQIDVLVATTVVEVGVDVANANVMVIEDAERFGLATLHQLRGRIGRGTQRGACVLLYDEPLGEAARERLKIVFDSNDGFEIARQDLRLRGPGEFLGARQWGLPLLRFADLERDQQLLERARQAAAALLLQHPQAARRHVQRWLPQATEFLDA